MVGRIDAGARNDPLAAVITARFGKRRLDRLTAEHAAHRAGLAPHRLAVQHQRYIVDSAEQQAPDEAAGPPKDGLPRPEVHRQHQPAARAASQVSDRVQHLTQVDRGLPVPPRRLRQQRLDPRPFLVRQVRRVALRLLAKLSHRAWGVSGKHPDLESPSAASGQAILKRSLARLKRRRWSPARRTLLNICMHLCRIRVNVKLLDAYSEHVNVNS